MGSKKKVLSHVTDDQKVVMVDVGSKSINERLAIAESVVQLDKEIISLFEEGDIKSKKGPVFQTAMIAGIMAVKKTSDLIPLCHPLAINKANIDISIIDNFQAKITCTVKVEGKTGVEMEALTGASVAALTIYDMCKAMSHDIEIVNTRLIKKTGGKKDFERA